MSDTCKWCKGTVDSSGVGGCFCTIARLRQRVDELERQLASVRKERDELATRAQTLWKDLTDAHNSVVELAAALEAAECPECGGAGYTVRGVEGERAERHPCDWCKTQLTAKTILAEHDAALIKPLVEKLEAYQNMHDSSLGPCRCAGCVLATQVLSALAPYKEQL